MQNFENSWPTFEKLKMGFGPLLCGLGKIFGGWVGFGKKGTDEKMGFGPLLAHFWPTFKNKTGPEKIVKITKKCRFLG